jgi:hypothetical protein
MIATIETTDKSELRAQIASLRGKIEAATGEIAKLQSKLKPDLDQLAVLQREYGDECLLMAQGQGGDSERAQSRIRIAESKIAGLRRLIASQEQVIASVRGELQPLLDTLARIEQAERERDEADEILRRFNQAKLLIEERDRLRRRFDDAVAVLRNSRYESARNQGNAKNYASQLERLEVGIVN